MARYARLRGRPSDRHCPDAEGGHGRGPPLQDRKCESTEIDQSESQLTICLIGGWR
jgi:hypothetical protein